jgi:hypothetical protein
MAKVWKITAHEVEHMGGGPPLKEYFLVAVSDQFAAMSALASVQLCVMPT